jgi:uncharacterized membrane protein (UPF0127 family)
MLQIENLTRKSLLVEKGWVADNFWTRLRGLMGVRQLAPGQGLLITSCNSIHTHFMSIPIDVLYVNQQNQIVAIDAQMPTWRFGRIQRNAYYILELPSGTVARTASVVGDQLRVLIR